MTGTDPFDRNSHPREVNSGRFTLAVGKEATGGTEVLHDDTTYEDVGFDHADGQEWADQGFSPDEAGEWSDRGFVADDAAMWDRGHFDADEAAELRDSGVSSPDDLPAWQRRRHD